MTETTCRLKRYFDPGQCCNCGSKTSVSPSEMKLVPILPPADGGTYRLENWALMCPPCRDATLYDTADKFEAIERPSDSLKEDILELDNEVCVVCGRKTEDKRGKPQCHHIRPLSRGGSNLKSNMVTVHKDCHNSIHKRERRNYHNGITLEQAKSLLRRAGIRLQEIEMFRDWMLPEHPPFEALEIYEEQYQRLGLLIKHYRQTEFPTAEMEPFIEYLENLQQVKKAKYMHTAYYHKQKARQLGEPVPTQVREITLSDFSLSDGVSHPESR